MLPRRKERISVLLHQAISEIIETGLKKTTPGLITITNVKVSPDVSIAWVDYTVIGADEIVVQKFLDRSAGFITSRLAAKIRLRALPKLKFSPDKTAKRAERIEELLREIKSEDSIAEDSSDAS